MAQQQSLVGLGGGGGVYYEGSGGQSSSDVTNLSGNEKGGFIFLEMNFSYKGK